MAKRRIKLTVAYEGTDFNGWQKQHPPDAPPLRTCQGVLEKAVREAVREEVSVHGASRTDSGVHAVGQVAAFDTQSEIEIDRLPAAISSRLPDDIRVKTAEVVPDNFNVISDVEAKSYAYRIAYGCRRADERPLFNRRLVSWIPWDQNLDTMRRAAEDLIGTHDFASFTRLNHGRESTIRTVYSCEVESSGPLELTMTISGSGFLWNMVRIMAGTLMEVGADRRDQWSIPATLAACDRAAAGVTMPPEGLMLQWIRYGPPGSGRQRQLEAMRHAD